MAEKTMPEDNFDPNATQMLDAGGDADRGSRPPSVDAGSQSDSIERRSDRETVIHRPASTQMDTMAFSKDEESDEISVSKLTNLPSMQETGEFSVDESRDMGTRGAGTVAANDVTGEFSVSGATMNPRLTERKTERNTLRSGGGGDNFEDMVPERIGNYQIKSVLGRGGMGVVYLASQVGLNRDVALKMVLAGAHASKNQLARFEAEAKAVAKLQHPNIVQVFEVGKQDGLPYFSLEFVDGMPLDQKLGGKPLPPREAAQVLEKICRAMQYAHERGILHRDLKPANILLTIDGQPKVTDFGLAKQLEDEDSGATKAGTIMGTPSYMSPEQAQGLVDELTPASDQYSLGAMLYELLTGRPPFLGTKAFDTISQVVHKEPVPPCQLQESMPVDIDTICLKALQKTADKRYKSCAEMAEDLTRFLKGEPILARPVSLLERGWRWCKRNPLIAIPSALAVCLLIATAVISSWSYMQISAQALIITDERDEAKRQRDEANKQRTEAEKQKLIATQNEEKATKEKEEAERQRILANEAKLLAEKNQQLAEQQAMLALQNIQFFITEIDEKLAKQPGMNELRIGMLEVLDKKWEELDKSLTGGIQGQAIPTQMAVRYKIAEAWTSLDKLEQANKQFEAIEKIARERLIVKNRNDATRVNLARLLVRWAPIQKRLTSDPAVEEKLQTEAHELLREVLKDPRPEPGSPLPFEVSDILQQSLIRNASLKIKAGKVEVAGTLYKEVQELSQKVLDDLKVAAPWTKEVSDERKTLIKSYFLQNLDIAKTGQANVLCRLGKVEQAIPVYEQAIESRRAGLAANPSDRNERDQLAMQYRNYGQYMLRSDRIEDAVRLIGNSHDLAEKNYSEDSKNANYKRAYGHSLYYWAVARSEAGQGPDSLALFERSRALRQGMFDVSPDQSNKVNLMLSEARLGNQEAAEKWIGELSKSTSKDPDLRIDLARALAQLSAQQPEADKRVELKNKAIAALEQAVADGLLDPFAVTSEVDLKPIRGESGFAKVVETIKAAAH
ncbi:MAG: serine/threonine-protein kinase [Pirellulales bacterium]